MREHVVTPYHTEAEEWEMFMIEPPQVFPFHITAGILDLACQALGTKQWVQRWARSPAGHQWGYHRPRWRPIGPFFGKDNSADAVDG